MLGSVLRLSSPRYDPPTVRDTGGFELPVISVSSNSSRLLLQRRAAEMMITYMVIITIGDKDFRVIFDTGSSDLWLASTECKTFDCQNIPLYNMNSSKRDPPSHFNATYTQGWASGTVEFGEISLGSLQISNQIFGYATNVSQVGLSTFGASGMFGLCFRMASNFESEAPLIMDNIVSLFEEEDKFFAFKLGGSRGPSFFSVGQISSSLMGDRNFTFFPVYPSTLAAKRYDFWKLPLTGIIINEYHLPLTAPLKNPKSKTPIAVLDSGTTFISGPEADVANFWEAVGGASYDNAARVWRIPCTRLANVSFVLGGVDGVPSQTYSLHPADVNWKDPDNPHLQWCLGGVQNGVTHSGDWLLGDTFLRNVYATHHMGTARRPPYIGLASLTDFSTATLDFRTERGEDLMAPGSISLDLQIHKPVSRVAIVSGSLVGSFVGGVVIALVVFQVTAMKMKWRWQWQWR